MQFTSIFTLPNTRISQSEILSAIQCLILFIYISGEGGRVMHTCVGKVKSSVGKLSRKFQISLIVDRGLLYSACDSILFPNFCLILRRELSIVDKEHS